MIDFPNTPVVGDIFKSGNYTYKCTQVSPNVWLSNPPNSAITDAPNDGLIYGRQSRAWVSLSGAQGFVKKSGDNMTGVLGLADGTVAAPGIAFASEPGLGWFRKTANVIAMAAQGARTVYVDASQANFLGLSMTPRAAGQSVIYLGNQPEAVANYNYMSMGVTAGGSGFLQATKVGTGSGTNSLSVQANDVIFDTSVAQVLFKSTALGDTAARWSKSASGKQNVLWGDTNGSNRWAIVPGDASGESTGNVGSDFQIFRYDNTGAFLGTGMKITRSDGTVLIPGPISASQGVTIGGNLAVLGAMSFFDSIDIAGMASNNPQQMYMRQKSTATIYSIVRNHDGWICSQYRSGNNMGIYDANTTALMYFVGNPGSDERTKMNIVPSNLDAVAQIEKMGFFDFNFIDGEFESDPSVRHHAGFISQNLQAIDPLYVTEIAKDRLAPNPNELLPLAMKAIQQINERLVALETP